MSNVIAKIGLVVGLLLRIWPDAFGLFPSSWAPALTIIGEVLGGLSLLFHTRPLLDKTQAPGTLKS